MVIMKLMSLIGVLFVATVVTTATASAFTMASHDIHWSRDSLVPTNAQEGTTTTGTETTDPPNSTTLTPGQSWKLVEVWLGDQTSNGTSVRVSIAALPEGGFVAVHTMNYSAERSGTYNTTKRIDPESVIGVSDYLAPGTHENVPVELSEPVNSTRELVVIAYHDTNRNENYEFVRSNGTVDGPYIVPYVSGKGGKTVVSGPALGTGLVAVNESLLEVRATVVAQGDAGSMRMTHAPTSVTTQENTEVRSSLKATNSGASEGSGPGFGALAAIIAIFSGFIIARRV